MKCSEPNLVKIKKNKITPFASGIATLSISLYEKSTNTKYTTTFANIYSIVENDLIEISTKEQLIDLQNSRSGNYIMKDDIDLKDVYWKPIGNMPANNAFSGMLVNLDDYKIKNLTVKSSQNVFQGPYGGCYVGLFGSSKNSFYYGLKLVNVNLNASDFKPEYSGSNVGGIVVGLLNDTFTIAKLKVSCYQPMQPEVLRAVLVGVIT